MLAPGTKSLRVDGRGRPLLSPSGAQLWQRCKRAFGWRYVEGLKDPPKPGQRLGTAYHAALERYFKGQLRSADDLVQSDYPALDDEQWRTLRRIVRAALRSGEYPEPVPGVVLSIEHKLEFDHKYASWNGFADLILARRAGPEVHDHKTTRSLDYALTDDELRTDPQGVVYSAATHEKLAQAGNPVASIGLQWTYVQTHGTAAVKAARASLTQAEASDRMAALDESVGGAVADLVVRPRHVLDLAPSWDRCDDFGGCPYQEMCGQRPVQSALSAALARSMPAVRAEIGSDMVPEQIAMPTFFEMAQQQTQGSAPAAPAPSMHQPAPVQATQATQANASQVLQNIFAQQAPSQPAPVAPPPPSIAPQQVQRVSSPSDPPVYAAVNRPGGPATAHADLYAAAQPAGQVGLVVPAGHVPQTQVQYVPPPADLPKAPEPVAPAVQAAAQAQVHQVQQPVAPIAQALEQAQSVAPAPAQTGTRPHGYWLAVGCAAEFKGPGPARVAVEDLLDRARMLLHEQEGLEDYRLVEYGKGPGHLLRALEYAMREAQIGQGHLLVVSHTGPEWQAVGQYLRAGAGAVFDRLAA